MDLASQFQKAFGLLRLDRPTDAAAEAVVRRIYSEFSVSAYHAGG
jgi:hypothetical protein